MPSSTSSAIHQAKRPYAGSHSHSQTQHQATITSYFPASSSLYQLSSNTTARIPAHDTSCNPLSPPALPPLVQSNLLSVGMRVRKSVPEGYKTGLPRKHGVVYDGGGGGTGWGFLDSGPASSPTSFKTHGGGGPGGGSTVRRELTPFCGIMKVGGMAVQGWDYGLEQEDREVPGEDDLPFLNSQGSTISSLSTDSRPGNKRRFDEEENEEPEGMTYDIWRDADDDVQLSPKTRPVDLAPGLGRRAMAVPKSRRKASGRDGGFKIVVMEGQENNNLGVLEVDFGEAEFMDWSSCLG